MKVSRHVTRLHRALIQRIPVYGRISVLEAIIDELREQLRRSEDANRDLRLVNRAVNERTRPGRPCTKVRYMHRGDAEQHAMWAAIKDPGETYNVYRCGSCRQFPASGIHPYHVGHDKPGRKGTVTVQDGVMHHGCGCRFSLRLDEFVWHCHEHGGN